MRLYWGGLKALEFTFADGTALAVDRGQTPEIKFNPENGEVKAGYYSDELYGSGLKSVSVKEIKIGQRRHPAFKLKKFESQIKNKVRLWPRHEKQLEEVRSLKHGGFIN